MEEVSHPQLCIVLFLYFQPSITILDVLMAGHQEGQERRRAGKGEPQDCATVQLCCVAFVFQSSLTILFLSMLMTGCQEAG